jgi:hypothetical protein
MAVVTVSSCEADCIYQSRYRCNYEGSISINEDFECEQFEDKDEQEE